MRFRQDLQGLRAVAVGLVILDHAGVERFSGGYVGVDVFFVVSGFLITSLLSRELTAGGRIAVGRFYARRFVRLLPVYALTTLVTLVAAWKWLSPLRFPLYAGDAAASSLYAINWRLAERGTDYLAQSDLPSPFQHLWSLAVEEQFYLLWPVLLLVTWKIAGRRLVAVPLALLCAGSLLWSERLLDGNAPFAYFGTHSRLWELGAGALLACAPIDRLPAVAGAVLSWLGLAGIVTAGLVYDRETAFPGVAALLPVLGTVAVLGGGATAGRSGAEFLLGRGPMQWIGARSYGWYLWHWPLVVIVPVALGRSEPWVAIAACAVGLVLAAITYSLVENPVREHRWFRGATPRGLAFGLVLSAGTAWLAFVAGAHPPAIGTGPAAADPKTVLAERADPEQALLKVMSAPPTALPSNLEPPLTTVKAERSRLYQLGCHGSYAATAVQPCVFGDRNAATTVVLFGDSHAAQWYPALDLIAQRRHWRLVTLTKSSCKISDVPIIINGGPYRACDEWRGAALTHIRDLRPAMVLMASSGSAALAPGRGKPGRRWERGFEHIIGEVAASGARPVILQDTPWPVGDIPECLAAHPADLAACTATRRSSLRDPDVRAALRTAAARTSTSIIDPTAWFCGTDGRCPPVAGNVLVYSDANHLTIGMSQILAPLLERRLSSL